MGLITQIGKVGGTFENQLIHHNNGNKKSNHFAFIENTFDKIQQLISIKTPVTQKEGNFNLIIFIIKSITNKILSGYKLKAYLLRSGTR